MNCYSILKVKDLMIHNCFQQYCFLSNSESLCMLAMPATLLYEGVKYFRQAYVPRNLDPTEGRRKTLPMRRLSIVLAFSFLFQRHIYYVTRHICSSNKCIQMLLKMSNMHIFFGKAAFFISRY